MQQPQGFVSKTYPSFVCHLQKAIYGLHQALRAWFQCFSSFLLKVGFVHNRADTSMFILHSSYSMLVLLLYVILFLREIISLF